MVSSLVSVLEKRSIPGLKGETLHACNNMHTLTQSFYGSSGFCSGLPG